MSTPKSYKPYTDVIFQQIRLYIEGVQIPFVSISITSGVGGLPTAQVSIPVQAGLMDIARFYQPKVHIFFEDRFRDYSDKDPVEDHKRWKLLFSGVVAQVSYSKTKNVGSATGISLNCVHKYNVMNDMYLDYTGWLQADPINPNESEGTKMDTANSTSTIIDALAGVKDPTVGGGTLITSDNPNGQSNILPNKYHEYYNRLLGMPGVMVNFWNQIKRSAYNRHMRQGNLYYSEAFVKMWQPLTEGGLQFFERLGGHYPLEAMVQADANRIDPCPETPGRKEKVIIPPSRQMFLSSAVQVDMTVSNIASYLQNSGEVTTIYQVFNNFYESIDYEIITLAAPAEVPIRSSLVEENEVREFEQASGVAQPKGTYALDTIVKPKMPFYFSPTCNVLFPGMYHSINVMYDEINIPTRVNLKNLEGPNQHGYHTNFRAPPSIREAIAAKVAGVNAGIGYDKNATYSLVATTGQSFGAIGLYEQGRGMKQEVNHLPRWLSHFSHSTAGGSQAVKESPPDQQSQANRYEALRQLEAGWKKRYPGDQRLTLNPYAIDVDISAHHRLIFAAADYYYTQAVARSRMGSVECLFNPFIVPGYPMDILEASPHYPSFHAMCNSVTHNFSGESCTTTVQFVAAMTYAELANYYVPFVSPMLQVALGLAETPFMVGSDPKAHKTADEFYRYTLGTDAIPPDRLLSFSNMLLLPQTWEGGKWAYGSTASLKDVNGGEQNPMLTYEGNLSLTYRNIESMADIERRFDLKFVDMSPANYGPSVILYKDQELSPNQKFELGRNQFLTYDTFFGFVIDKQNTSEDVTR